eukprot:2420826-Rhodomonas_salina.1
MIGVTSRLRTRPMKTRLRRRRRSQRRVTVTFRSPRCSFGDWNYYYYNCSDRTPVPRTASGPQSFLRFTMLLEVKTVFSDGKFCGMAVCVQVLELPLSLEPLSPLLPGYCRGEFLCLGIPRGNPRLGESSS